MQDWAFSKQDGACSDCLNISSAPNGTDEGYGGTYNADRQEDSHNHVHI